MIAESKIQITFVSVNEENEAGEVAVENGVEGVGLVDEEIAGEVGTEEGMIETETSIAGEEEVEEGTTDDHNALLDLHQDAAIPESVTLSGPLPEATNPIFHKGEVVEDRMIVIEGDFLFLGHHQKLAQSPAHPVDDVVPRQDLVLHPVAEQPRLRDVRTRTVEVVGAEEETEVPIEDHVGEALALQMALFLVLHGLQKDGQLQDLQVLHLHLDLVGHEEILVLDLFPHQDLLHPTEKKRLLVRQMMLQSRGRVEAVNVTIVG